MGDQTGPGGPYDDDGGVRSYPITDEGGTPLGAGCGPTPATAGDVAAVRAFAETLRFAPGAEITVAGGGVPISWGEAGGPVVGTVTSASVDDRGQVHAAGHFAGQGFEAVVDGPEWADDRRQRWGVERDWSDVDEAAHRPLPLPERWQR